MCWECRCAKGDVYGMLGCNLLSRRTVQTAVIVKQGVWSSVVP